MSKNYQKLTTLLGKLEEIMKNKLLGVALVAGSLSGFAEDAKVDRDVYFSILGGVQDFHSSNEDNSPILSNSLDESDAIAAELGFMFTDHSAFQLSYTKLNPDDAIGFGDEDLVMTSIDYMYYVNPDRTGGAYIRAGIGRYEFEDEFSGGGWEESDVYRFGLGFEDGLSDFWSWRGEIGVIRDETTKRLDTQLLLGLTMNFGGSDPKPVVAKPKPVQAPVVERNTKKDSDRDGVFDANDQCPETAQGVVVDPQGCELDSDGDGIVNSKDSCAATPTGAKVDSRGCRLVLEETVRQTLNVKFKTNSSELQAEFKSDIAKLAKFMTEYPDTSVTIEGHTDSVGKASYNQWLSDKRAKSVANELVNTYGIAANRVNSRGFGESNPIADNSTQTGRAKNRRVEAVIEAKVRRPQ
ncbi:OmpA family protein [Pleionea sediminis]|uniref:OmpA family protein n=1 Tax=Pleionea sediminis TaxID=2569479 RepID=UPI0013DDFD8F|nr:OmpA family protein [Pleionea sediminis]